MMAAYADPYITYMQPTNCDLTGCKFTGSIEGLTLANHSISALNEKFNTSSFEILDWFDRIVVRHMYDFDMPATYAGICSTTDLCLTQNNMSFIVQSVGDVYSVYNVTNIMPVRRASLLINGGTSTTVELVDGGDLKIGKVTLSSVYTFNTTNPNVQVGDAIVVRKSVDSYVPMVCPFNAVGEYNTTKVGVLKMDTTGAYYDRNVTVLTSLLTNGLGGKVSFSVDGWKYGNLLFSDAPALWYSIPGHESFSGPGYSCVFTFRTVLKCNFTSNVTSYFTVNSTLGDMILYGQNESKTYVLPFPSPVWINGTFYFGSSSNANDTTEFFLTYPTITKQIIPRTINHKICYVKYCNGTMGSANQIRSKMSFTLANGTAVSMSLYLDAPWGENCLEYNFNVGQPNGGSPTWNIPDPIANNITLQPNLHLGATNVTVGGGSVVLDNTTIDLYVDEAGSSKVCLPFNLTLGMPSVYRWRARWNSTDASQQVRVTLESNNWVTLLYDWTNQTTTVYSDYFDANSYGLPSLYFCLSLTSFTLPTDLHLVAFGAVDTLGSLFRMDSMNHSLFGSISTCTGYGYLQYTKSQISVTTFDPHVASVDLSASLSNCRNVPLTYSGDTTIYALDITSPRAPPSGKKSVVPINSVDQIYSLGFDGLVLDPDNDTSIPIKKGVFIDVVDRDLFVNVYFKEVNSPGIVTVTMQSSPIGRLSEVESCSVQTVLNVTVLCQLTGHIEGDLSEDFQIVLGTNVDNEYAYDDVYPIYLNKTDTTPWYSFGKMDTRMFWIRVSAMVIAIILVLVGIMVCLGPIFGCMFYTWMIAKCLGGCAWGSAKWSFSGFGWIYGKCGSCCGWCFNRAKKQYSDKFKTDQELLPTTQPKMNSMRKKNAKKGKTNGNAGELTGGGGGGGRSSKYFTSTLTVCCIVSLCMQGTQSVCVGNTLSATNVTACVDGVCDMKLHISATVPLTQGAEYCVSYDAIDTQLGSVVSDSVEIHLKVQNVTVSYPLLWQYYSGQTVINHKSSCECPNGNDHFCTSSKHPSSLDCPLDKGCSYVQKDGSNDGCGIYLVGNGHYCTMSFPNTGGEMSVLKFQQQPSRLVCFIVTVTSSTSNFSYDFCWDGIDEHDEVIDALPGRVNILGSYDSDYLSLSGNYLIRSKSSAWISSLVNAAGEFSMTKSGWAQMQDPTNLKAIKYDPNAISAITTMTTKSCGSAKVDLSYAYRNMDAETTANNAVINYVKPYGVPTVVGFGSDTTFTVAPYSGPNSAFEFVLDPGTIKYSIDAAFPVIDSVEQSVVNQDGFVGYLIVTLHSNCGPGQVQVRAIASDSTELIVGDDCVKVVDGPTNCTIPIQGVDNTTVIVVAQGYFVSVNETVVVTVSPPLDLTGDVTTQDDASSGENDGGGSWCWTCWHGFHTIKDAFFSIFQLLMSALVLFAILFIFWQVFRLYKALKSLSQRKME